MTIDFHNESLVRDCIHAGLAMDLDDHIYLFGKKNYYKVRVADQSVEVLKNVHISSI